jgi:hypothetical protein
MIVKNPDHAMRALIEAAKTKVKRGASLARSKSAFWYLLGVGALLAGAGILCGGYSYITGNEVIARQTAEGVAAALAHTTIKTDGTVTLANGAQVTLADGGRVSLDPTSALLRVVIGQAPDTPRAQPEQVRQDEPPTVAKAGVLRNFTVLQTVTFGAGQVHTGWEYKDGGRRPSFQYCQYTQFAGNATTQTHVVIGENGRMALPNPSPLPAVNLRAAYEAGCRWANDAAPVAPAVPVQSIQIHAAKR